MTSRTPSPPRAVRSRPKAVRAGRPKAPPSHSPVRALRTALGFSQPVMARLLGVSLRTVTSLEGRRAGMPPRSFLELRRLYKGLSQIMRAGFVGAWMQLPIESLGGSTPLQAVERGEQERLWAIIHRVGSGEPG